MSVISANCVGAFILHDLNGSTLILSVCANLYLDPSDFVRYLTEHHILSSTNRFNLTQSRKTVPSWSLGDLKGALYALTTPEQEAREKWDARSQQALNLDDLLL